MIYTNETLAAYFTKRIREKRKSHILIVCKTHWYAVRMGRARSVQGLSPVEDYTFQVFLYYLKWSAIQELINFQYSVKAQNSK